MAAGFDRTVVLFAQRYVCGEDVCPTVPSDGRRMLLEVDT